MADYNKKIREFTILIGYINLAIQMDSYKEVKEEYINLLNIILLWGKNYIENHNFDNIESKDIKKIYSKIDLIREKILFDKNIGDEKIFSDHILIWYEIVFLGKEKGE